MKTINKVAISVIILLFVRFARAQSVLITPEKSKVSDTLNVKGFLYVGEGVPVESGSIFQVKAEENAIFYIPTWGLSGTEVITGNFYSPTGNAPQVRFESEGNSFFDIGRKGTTDFVIEYDDDPMLTLTNTGQLNVRRRLTFSDTGRSVFIGEDAGKNDDLTDNNNVYIGHWAGNDNAEGENNVAIGTEAFSGSLGSYNFALGTHALQNNLNGNDNIAIGNFAGYASDGSNNILIGSGTGESLVGTRNIIIGRELGNTKTMDNALWIDVENIENPLIQGDFFFNSLKINGKFSTTDAVGLKTDTPKSTLDVNGSMGVKVHSGLESGVDNVDNTAGIWIYTTASGDINLPPASTCPNRVYTIVNKTASTLTISEFKDLTNTVQTTILSAKSIEIVSDGSEWQQIR